MKRYTLPLILGAAMNGVALLCMLVLPSPGRWLPAARVR